MALLGWFKKIFETPKLEERLPSANTGGALSEMLDADERRHLNEMRIERANFNLQKQALQANLRIAHRSSLAAIFAALVALLIGVATLILSIALRPHPVTVEVVSPRAVQVKH